MRTCTKCGVSKEDSFFPLRNYGGYEYYRGECKECHAIMARQYRKDNSHRIRITRAARNYKISEELVNQIYDRTVCEICNLPFKNQKDKSIDHNHTTGEVRGLLCTNCNVALGNFQDSIPLLKSAIKYLNKYK